MRDAVPLNIYLVGERQVGKSTLIQQVIGDSFRTRHHMKFVHECIVDGVHVVVNIYDLSNDLNTLSMFSRHGNCVFVLDATRPFTFDSTIDWRMHFLRHTTHDPNSYNDIHVIANKIDLAGEATSLDEFVKYMGEDVRMFRTNARSKELVQSVFESIVRDALEKRMNMMFVDFENY